MGTAFAIVAGLLVVGSLYEWISRTKDSQLRLPGRLVDLGGYRLHLTEEGVEGPTVVIIPGAGDTSLSWMAIRKQLASSVRLLSYDRPGIGGSDPGPAPSVTHSTTELHELLDRAGATGPHILVGHSLGGLLARLYALRYPEQVAGLVLVDSTHEDLATDVTFRRGFALVGVLAKLLRFLSFVGLPRFLGAAFRVMPMYPELKYYAPQLTVDEFRVWTAIAHRNLTSTGALTEIGSGTIALIEEAKRLQRPDQFGEMPVAVLTNPGYGASWLEMHKELASRSSNALHLKAERSGHSIQMTSPELVLQAIHHVIHQVRDRRSSVS